MSEPDDRSHLGGVPSSHAGPTVSFVFNLAKVPDQGEDSDPILRQGRDLGLLAVFDGMGGAGGTVYDTPDGKRTGAYLASRIARDVVERRMVQLLEPDWYLDGKAAAEDLRRSVKEALVQRLEELKAPKSGLRSKLLRALPTTMALVALQRMQPGGDRWTCHVLWAGDSRAYVFEPGGAHQLSTDDLRDPGDAMANLGRDSVVSNAMSADTDFDIRYRKVELRVPFVVACATDGCFGYLRSPMHFEHLVLSHLRGAASVEAWCAGIQADITKVTGDDAAMAALAVGADLDDLERLFAPRIQLLESDLLAPLDSAVHAVVEAEGALEVARRRQLETGDAVWRRYKPAYERYLQQSDAGDDDPDDGEVTRRRAGRPVTEEPAKSTLASPDPEPGVVLPEGGPSSEPAEPTEARASGRTGAGEEAP